MKNSNALVILAVLAVIVTLLTLIVAVNKMTGKATDTATANFTINSAASISFITDVINWGSGSVDEIPTFGILDTEGTTTNTTGFTTVNQGLTLQNDGNVNVTVNITFSKNAAGFIGGTNPTFKWKASDNESNSCNSAYNPSFYSGVSNISATNVCSNMPYDDSHDAFDIDLQVEIPEDAVGTKGCVITAIASAI